MNKQKVTINLTPEALRLLELLSKKYGISRSAILEIIIRDKAQKDNLE